MLNHIEYENTILRLNVDIRVQIELDLALLNGPKPTLTRR